MIFHQFTFRNWYSQHIFDKNYLENFEKLKEILANLLSFLLNKSLNTIFKKNDVHTILGAYIIKLITTVNDSAT